MPQALSTRRRGGCCLPFHRRCEMRVVAGRTYDCGAVGQGLRNVLMPSYFQVDLETIWTIIQRDLSVLETAARQLLEESSPRD